ncbi:serine protease gd-like [Neocloeon triangulifer]|uniref:serine protease gd-like n=1 Tax=Neocloeon triangulifer TaxID=2078957 RepID=UPI00286ED66D|nr:serine protease gd-like [Neocloeon triangulifer]XP_059482147.1 serine protease gd-like [Neocloeon triangulifer]XP_059482148.1 serine protease gd-like [Neocloeon triangulifer]XP_059482149.1 serine protease gd-like [Neocloeon triangulifer]XP_059482150.1 serine protease gd-like [Neocloeon triangulifer]
MYLATNVVILNVMDKDDVAMEEHCFVGETVPRFATFQEGQRNDASKNTMKEAHKVAFLNEGTHQTEGLSLTPLLSESQDYSCDHPEDLKKPPSQQTLSNSTKQRKTPIIFIIILALIACSLILICTWPFFISPFIDLVFNSTVSSINPKKNILALNITVSSLSSINLDSEQNIRVSSTEPESVHLEPYTLLSMPKILKPKPKKDFGPNQSFPGCGLLVGRGKREAIEARGFVISRENAVRGQHPWHASISVRTETGFVNEDFCGATLISKRVLVTAAHCFFDKNEKKIEASHVEVTLGMHNRSIDNETEPWQQIFTNLSVVVHPSFNHTKKDYKDDIALVILEREVNTTTKYVRPICLWNDDYELNKISNNYLTVVGWGYNSNLEQPDILKKATLKVASYEECFESDPKFFSKFMRPTENFCAGIPQNRTSACVGDSGGGLTSYDRDAKRHYLRGVVSMGKFEEISNIITCNPEYYSLYTDVTNYMDWIIENSPDINL